MLDEALDVVSRVVAAGFVAVADSDVAVENWGSGFTGRGCKGTTLQVYIFPYLLFILPFLPTLFPLFGIVYLQPYT
jgi:hypothetical protein